MRTTKTYQIDQVTCYKSDCNLKFDVLISSVDTVVTRPVEESDFSLSKETSIVKEGIITDYIVVKCPSGHEQRVFLNSIKS